MKVHYYELQEDQDHIARGTYEREDLPLVGAAIMLPDNELYRVKMRLKKFPGNAWNIYLEKT